jgi:hypothetical protein
MGLILHLRGFLITPAMMVTQQLFLEETLTRRVFNQMQPPACRIQTFSANEDERQ